MISLPKGGGAVRGIGEKFSANPATGTGSLSIPLPVSPGRSGFGPSLALVYDSGAAHGPFGMGWSIGLPSITRRTDKGLPTYDDASESDVFLLSGAEDLVPVVGADGKVERRPRTVGNHRYVVVRYRPRIEGLYARIERWTCEDGDIHWRSISRDNTTTLYGRDGNSRIFDPDDRRRVFSWLICESFDDKGNAIEYSYKQEDSTDVDVAAAHERHRNDNGGKRRNANRYLKSVRYGNRVSRLAPPSRPVDDGWLFELVFDYGEHDKDSPTPGDTGRWWCRNDPFSSYRAGFEVRTYRLCQRILMFHHFPSEAGVGTNCPVRSMTLKYRSSRGVDDDRQLGHPAGAFLASVTVAGHRRAGTGYLTREMPPLELEYSTATLQSKVHELDAVSLENLPVGLEAPGYRWVDLDGESISGVLTEQAGAWFYKPNLGGGRLGPLQTLPSQPSVSLGGDQTQLLDLAGDGQLDVVSLGGPVPGFFERTEEGWAPHKTFASLPNVDWGDPNLRLVDLNGDGHADVLITEDDAIVFYPSLAEDGFGPAVRVPTARDEDVGPRLVFADGTQSVYLADFSGDGLLDLARVRNGEVSFWPNMGHGRFGARVVMDGSPWFDRPDLFDHRRLHLADLDDTGPIDLVYITADGVDLYTNQMGNSWSIATRVPAFPAVDDATSVSVVDLLGRGTACLVWSSPLPGDAGRQVRYIDLMGIKPHLLTRVRNNLGAETAVTYASSTAFYLADKAEGRPWITRLPFPVHVVERVETYDRINRNRFVTRYTYHDGYFDGPDQEFRGFGMVVQDDTEHMAALVRSEAFPSGDNVDESSHVPPVRTRWWFHTGAYLGRDRLSRLFAGQYYPPPEHAVPEALTWLLDDTPLPGGLRADTEREACRALKGQMLRQETYALDGTEREPHPYTVIERNYTVRAIQNPHGKRHGVFAVDARETLTATCERNPTDARVGHEVVLATDPFGAVLHSVAIAYRRGTPDTTLPERTRAAQATTLVTETQTFVTNPKDTEVDDGPAGQPTRPDAYRIPVPFDVQISQLSGTPLDHKAPRLDRQWLLETLATPTALQTAGVTRRLIARQRNRFHADDLSGPLDFGTQGELGLPYESYQLALTTDVLTEAFGVRVNPGMLTAAGYVQQDGAWWRRSGTVRYAPEGQGAAAVLAQAREHFYLPRRFVDPFAAVANTEYGMAVEYDRYDLLPVETCDPLGNLVTAGERDTTDARLRLHVDYRVLAPTLVTDPNRNRVAVTFDVLGRVATTAVMGKPGDDTGDRVDPAASDLNGTTVAAFWANPRGTAPARLGTATTRLVYDIDAYLRTRDSKRPQPPGVATIARERHVAALASGAGPSPLQLSFEYSDGLGREVQRKLQAEPDKPAGAGAGGATPRWIGTGWVVHNNKGNPVRQYEPFFTTSHAFEFAAVHGVGPVLCYDPPGRVIATLYPDHSYEKVIFDAWQQWTWDGNDTLIIDESHPLTEVTADPHVGRWFVNLPETDYSPAWYAARIAGALGEHAKVAAERAARHARTPTRTCLDPFGRPILTVAHNRTPGETKSPPVTTMHRNHVVLDVMGRALTIVDCLDGSADRLDPGKDRDVMRYAYDLTGTRVVEGSMEAGTRRLLPDVSGAPVEVWETMDGGAPDRRFHTEYDRLRRPVAVRLIGGSAGNGTVERVTYGEAAPDAAMENVRGQVWEVRDGAGLLTQTFDVKGNLRRVDRRFACTYRETIDWFGADDLETETWTTRAKHDALNRLVDEVLADGTTVHRTYNEAGRPDSIAARPAGDPSYTAFVRSIDYNERGQRTAVEYGHDVTTTYRYDPHTFRLTSLLTKRNATFNDKGQPPDQRRWVQNLAYVYDPVGNISHIQDNAQPRVFNLNTAVDASTDYVYDALYRLVTAEGREHLGLNGGTLRAPAPTSATDTPRVHPSDRNALGRYRERYYYDVAGNLKRHVHLSTGSPAAGWTRVFTCDERSQLQTDRTDLRSNRLSSTAVGNRQPENYRHDQHGNMTALPPMQLTRWNDRNQLVATSLQSRSSGAPESTYYSYDRDGERVRKVTDNAATAGQILTRKSERLYLGEVEVYRTFDGGGKATPIRTTVHIVDGEQRVAIVERRVKGSDTFDQHLVRYEHANHLGSAAVELDDDAVSISYEEYYPYGCTALLITRPGAVPKRYRYTAKERDEETGLNYHGSRYYAPWLQRWTSPDPLGTADGPNLYLFVHDCPANFIDNSGFFERQVTGIFHGEAHPGDVVYTHDPEMAARIEELTGGLVAQLHEFGTGRDLPVGPPGGFPVLRQIPGMGRMPSLTEELGLKGEIHIGGLTLRQDLDVLGGYYVTKVYGVYWITPEEILGNGLVVPASIAFRGIEVAPEPTAALQLGLDALALVGAAKGLGGGAKSTAPKSFPKNPYSNIEVRGWVNDAEKQLERLRGTPAFSSRGLEDQARLAHTVRNSLTGEARSMMRNGGIVDEPIKGLDAYLGRSLAERDAAVYGAGGRTFENVYNGTVKKLQTAKLPAAREDVLKAMIESSTKANKSVNRGMGIKR